MSNGINKKEKNRRLFVFGGMALLALLILGVTLFSIMGNKERLSSNVNNAVSRNVDGTVAGEASEKYTTMLIKHDNEQAKLAEESGESFFATPTKERVEEKPKEEAPTPMLVKNEPKPAPTPAPAQPKFTADDYKRMTDFLKSLDSQINSQMYTGAIFYVAEETTNNALNQVKQDTLPSENTESYFTAGDMFYAILDTAVNSDIPSAVVATVVAGDLRKTKFFGSFTRYEKRLVVKFERAILSDGTEITIEAYAVDPKTTEASVADKVNTHAFSRWGGLIAASFLEGFGEAVSNTGTTTTTTSDYSVSEAITHDYSLTDQAWIAAGKVGERASEVFANQFNRVPTVYLNIGSAMGILIVQSDKKS